MQKGQEPLGNILKRIAFRKYCVFCIKNPVFSENTGFSYFEIFEKIKVVHKKGG